MKKWAVSLAALVALVVLVVFTISAGQHSGHSKGPVVLVSPPANTSVPNSLVPNSSVTSNSVPGQTTATALPEPKCHFGADPAPAGTGPPSSVHLAGGCTGNIVAPFVCSAAIDDLYASAREPIDYAHGVYLTLNVESYKGPGVYPLGQAFVQLSGPLGSETWTNRTLQVTVGADQSIKIQTAELAPDPGTGSSGITTLSGNVACGS